MKTLSTPILCLALLAGPACLKKDPLYCDENTPCMDPERPYCDLAGEFPASDGIKRTCIPSPFDAGAEEDAGPERHVVDIALGASRTCAVLDDGALRCWGTGQLGYPAEVGRVGDDEHPFEVGDVKTGGPVRQVALGKDFNCILYAAGNVRCFGQNGLGQLGYGHTDDIVAEPADVDDVSLGGPAKSIAAAAQFTCALLESGAVRCWGAFDLRCSGYGDGEEQVGDDEVPTDKTAIEVGGAVEQIEVGATHICALLAGGDGRVRCWGFGVNGALGYGTDGAGSLDCVGDTGSPADRGDVDTDDPVRFIRAYGASNCVQYENEETSCWGDGATILGYGTTTNYGDNESAGAAPNLMIGGVATDLGGGPKCALMSDRSVRCWGRNDVGQLGLGHTEDVGNDEVPLDADPIALGGTVKKLAHGLSNQHMCVIMDDDSVRCWGNNEDAQLGLGHREDVGDTETPADVPSVRVLR